MSSIAVLEATTCYMAVCSAAIGAELVHDSEPTMIRGMYALAVIRNGTIIGHMPRKRFKVCSLLYMLYSECDILG